MFLAGVSFRSVDSEADQVILNAVYGDLYYVCYGVSINQLFMLCIL